MQNVTQNNTTTEFTCRTCGHIYSKRVDEGASQCFQCYRFEKELIAQGFTQYRYEPSGFLAWSMTDLCTTDKGWYIA